MDATGAPEFRGVVFEDGRALFSLYLPELRHAVWVARDESSFGLQVVRYNAAGQTLMIERGGIAFTLALASAPIRILSVSGPDTAAMAPGITVPSPDPETEAHRVEQLAQEVRRRRAVPSR